MTDIFKTKKEARDFLEGKMKNCCQVQTQVLMTFSDGIISQEHFSFFDLELNGNYNASILETEKGFQVEIKFKKHSELVLAAEVGNLNLFKEQLKKNQSQDALSLAFNMAILRENLNILQFYYASDYIKSLTLYEEPLIMAAKYDKLNAFQFLIRKGGQVPIEILAEIFHNNSSSVMKYILQDTSLSKLVLEERFQTAWAKKGLSKKDNEATTLFKALANGG